MDVDEANQDLEVLQKAAMADKTIPAFPQTSMSTFVHLLRLKILDSEIQHNIYRVDRPHSSKGVYQSTDRFLERLQAWKEAIPPQSMQWGTTEGNNFRGDEYMSYDSYVRCLDL